MLSWIRHISISEDERLSSWSAQCMRAETCLSSARKATRSGSTGRRGGVGYEGHIITAEILSSVGANKFIPVLRQGDWPTAMPTPLNGSTELTCDQIRWMRIQIRWMRIEISYDIFTVLRGFGVSGAAGLASRSNIGRSCRSRDSGQPQQQSECADNTRILGRGEEAP
jgi:hypothetical protein